RDHADRRRELSRHAHLSLLGPRAGRPMADRPRLRRRKHVHMDAGHRRPVRAGGRRPRPERHRVLRSRLQHHVHGELTMRPRLAAIAVAAIVAALLPTTSNVAAQPIPGTTCNLFPANNIFNTDISSLAVASQSAMWKNNMAQNA